MGSLRHVCVKQQTRHIMRRCQHLWMNQLRGLSMAGPLPLVAGCASSSDVRSTEPALPFALARL